MSVMKEQDIVLEKELWSIIMQQLFDDELSKVRVNAAKTDCS